MARVNRKVSKTDPAYTFEGARAYKVNPELQLRRSVMACLLFEGTFYEDGVSIAERISGTIPKVDPQKVADIAVEARRDQNLRHVPLLIVREMARLKEHKKLVADTLERVIQRADELTEFLSIYWMDKRQPLSAQVKKGLARAFPKFDAYQLAKYNRDDVVKLRDALFLSHAKPKDKEQAETWKQLVDGTLTPPDTWEVALSGGKDKKETWDRMIREGKLGGMAFLRNLRNMEKAKVEDSVIREGFEKINTSRVLPFRFIAAARHAPRFEPELEKALFRATQEAKKLSGKTTLVVDVSGSMEATLSDRSQMTRMDAACGLGMILREICDDIDVITFSQEVVMVPPRRGFALRDAIVGSQAHWSTYLGKAVQAANETKSDRTIMVTDEQSHDQVGAPVGKGYMINVGSYKNGVGYGAWLHLDGWSESIVRYVQAYEEFTNATLL